MIILILMENEILFPMKAVTIRTGLSGHLLRVWERRYGVVVPRRSQSNRRLYSESEVGRLILLKRTVEAGHPIGRICALPNEDLMRLANLPSDTDARTAAQAGVNHSGDPAELLSRAKASVRSMDGAMLGNILQQAAVQLSRPVLIEEVVLPLMQFVGDLWQSGELRIAHEHVATGVIRFFLTRLIQREILSEGAPRLVVASVSGQVHEFGALLAAAVAVYQGWKVTYLGVDLPAEEIAAVAASTGARAIALSLVYPAGDPAVAEEIRSLRSCVPEEVALIIGGRAAASYMPLFDPAGVVYLDKISGLPKALHELQ